VPCAVVVLAVVIIIAVGLCGQITGAKDTQNSSMKMDRLSSRLFSTS